MKPTEPLPTKIPQTLAKLRNVGRATLADFRTLHITTVEQLAAQNADTLYHRLCTATSQHHDPCVRDVFSATIHEARTGEALDWWRFTAVRKARLAADAALAHHIPPVARL